MGFSSLRRSPQAMRR